MSTDLRDTIPPVRAVANETRMIDAMTTAAGRIPPLWPLRDFVAVNPFVGHLHEGFGETAHRLARIEGIRTVMPRAFYAKAIREGRIERADLDAAAKLAPEGSAFAGDGRALGHQATLSAKDVRALRCVAELATELHGDDWTSFVVDSVCEWAEGYFAHAGPGEGSPFAHWRAQALQDRTGALRGLAGFTAFVSELGDEPLVAAHRCLNVLGIADLSLAGLERYFHCVLVHVRGWAGHARYRAWHAEGGLSATSDLTQLLCILLAYEAAVLQGLGDPEMRRQWARRRASFVVQVRHDADLQVDLLLHDAYERSATRSLLRRLAPSRRTPTSAPCDVQAAFCIDVRSERFRRSLESADPTLAIDTIGVAGFFGAAIEVVSPDRNDGLPHCPALITPSCQASDASVPRNGWWAETLDTFKSTGLASLGFVETLGLVHAVDLVRDALGLRPAPTLHSRAELDGVSLESRVDLAEGVLRAMSLTRNFARLVLLCGHASSTRNNPYASGLDCGACGGHSGGPNARVVTAALNDPEIRARLEERGVSVPTETLFLAGVHETVTDVVEVLDMDEVPASHKRELGHLRKALGVAGDRCRLERLAKLGDGTPSAGKLADARRRSSDWSEVRPEWGLAGCASFIIAPRQRTRGMDLEGRAFLHSYAWRDDEGFAVLESLMTAPLVVGAWINLQYYASSVEPALGSGDKTLHNVVGDLGVVEGSCGDLRVGLPMQSVHDGEEAMHEPVRLHAIIEAPRDAITTILRRNPDLCALFEGGWMHLFCMSDAGAIRHRYVGDGSWASVTADEEIVATGS